MAVDWGKAGRFACFLRFAAIFGFCGQLRLCDSAWVLGVFGALICRNFVCFCICVRVNVFTCGKMNFLRCVLCDGVLCGDQVVKKRSFWPALCRRGTRCHKGA